MPLEGPIPSRPAVISAQEKCLCQKLDGSAGPAVQKIELKGGSSGSWDQEGKLQDFKICDFFFSLMIIVLVVVVVVMVIFLV